MRPHRGRCRLEWQAETTDCATRRAGSERTNGVQELPHRPRLVQGHHERHRRVPHHGRDPAGAVPRRHDPHHPRGRRRRGQRGRVPGRAAGHAHGRERVRPLPRDDPCALRPARERHCRHRDGRGGGPAPRGREPPRREDDDVRRGTAPAGRPGPRRHARHHGPGRQLHERRRLRHGGCVRRQVPGRHGRGVRARGRDALAHRAHRHEPHGPAHRRRGHRHDVRHRQPPVRHHRRGGHLRAAEGRHALAGAHAGRGPGAPGVRHPVRPGPLRAQREGRRRSRRHGRGHGGVLQLPAADGHPDGAGHGALRRPREGGRRRVLRRGLL